MYHGCSVIARLVTLSTTNTLETKGNRAPNRPANKKPRSDAARSARVAKKTISARSLEDWLYAQSFPVNPTVKVNGPSTEASILTVDFGSPKEGPVRLTSDQARELISRMEKLAGEFYVGEVPISVSYDQSNGVYWARIR